MIYYLYEVIYVKLIELDTEMFLKHWGELLSIREMADVFQCSTSVVRKKLKSLDIPCDRSAMMSRYYAKLHDEKWDEIKAKLDDNVSVEILSKEYNIAKESLRCLMKRHEYEYHHDKKDESLRSDGYRQQLVDLLDTHTVREICEILGKSETTVRRHMRNFGLTKSTVRDDVSDTDVLLDWNRGFSIMDIARKYDCSHDTITKRLKKQGVSCDRKTGIERQTMDVCDSDSGTDGPSVKVVRVVHDLERLGIVYELNNRSILKSEDNTYFEIDIYLPDFKLGIEVNPTWTHSVDTLPYGQVDKKYHQKKSLLAKQHGIGLVHLYDTDFIDEQKYQVFLRQLESLLVTKIKIGARKCSICKIDRKSCNAFLEQYHFQGDEQNSFVQYGMLYDNVLIGVFTIGKSRYTNDSYEIIRYCMRPDFIVHGCFDKFLNAFLQDVNVSCTIVSYMDLNKRLIANNVYEKHGFVFDKITTPDYVWIQRSGLRYKTRYSVTKSQLVKAGFDASKTEVEIMKEQSYCRVYGAGSKRYVYNYVKEK